MKLLALFALFVCHVPQFCPAQALDYAIELTSPTKLSTPDKTWAQPRAGTIPPRSPGNASDLPVVIMTMQHSFLRGSDLFGPMHQMRTDDLGKTWQGPAPVPGYELRPMENNRRMNIADFTPRWHAASGKLLGTGVTTDYPNDDPSKPAVKSPPVRHWVAYAAFDASKSQWGAWKKLEITDKRFFSVSAGCTQRYDLPNGDILLPVSTKALPAVPGSKQAATTVIRCRFDGETLTYVEHGSEMTVAIDRGLLEASITKFGERFYLTMRNDRAAYVSSSAEGLKFDEPRKWTFDDGTDLGSYNTQAHWVTHSEGLFLSYTRRGANNDNVFRHRAPLFIAKVDPDKLQVIRASERELMPNRGVRLGNFSVTDVSVDQTWVTDCEWMSREAAKNHTADGSVWVAKIHWNKPNAYAK